MTCIYIHRQTAFMGLRNAITALHYVEWIIIIKGICAIYYATVYYGLVYDLKLYGTIVFLVKFVFCTFLLLMYGIYLVNKDNYYYSSAPDSGAVRCSIYSYGPVREVHRTSVVCTITQGLFAGRSCHDDALSFYTSTTLTSCRTLTETKAHRTRMCQKPDKSI